jgi:hypothetical protein
LHLEVQYFQQVELNGLKTQWFAALLFFGLIAFAGSTRWQNLQEEPLIMTDGQGYHAYLPAIFLYQDLQFDFVSEINEQYYPEGKRAAFIYPTKGGNVNKYFVGTAVIQAPFFAAGSVLSAVVGEPVDGYSWPFQLMVGLGAIVCLVLGVWWLGRLLSELGFKRWAVFFSLLFVVFGTNLLYYTLYEPSMSHVYSFMTISALLHYSRRALISGSGRAMVFAGTALGLTVLIRPTNGLVVFGIPAVVGGLTEFLVGIESILKKKRWLTGGLVLGVSIMSIQPIIYWLQTGSPLVWSYAEEGFNFLDPEITNVLFSYRKGLFVYCPVLLIALAGIAKGAFKSKSGFVELSLFLLLIVWVISSWWMWHYGGCYGHRAFIDYYPFFAIGLAYGLDKGIGIISPTILKLIGIGLIVVQLVQTYQYKTHIIPFDNITETKYWNLFLRTGKDLAWYYSGNEGQDKYVGLDSTLVTHTFEQELGWGNEDQAEIYEGFESEHAAVMWPDKIYGPTFKRNVDQTAFNLIRVSGWVRPDSRSSKVVFVCSLEDSTGSAYYWQGRPLRPQFEGKNEWSWVSALFRCGAPRDSTDRISVFPMKTDSSSVVIDDLEISLVETR